MFSRCRYEQGIKGKEIETVGEDCWVSVAGDPNASHPFVALGRIKMLDRSVRQERGPVTSGDLFQPPYTI